MSLDLNPFLDNPLKDGSFESVIPPVTRKEDCIIGIDEAGRGPVLGPMVYGLAYFPLSEEKALKGLEFADSKTLTEEKREDIFGRIGEKSYRKMGWFATVLSPVTISNSMFKRTKYNLNELSHDTAIGLIRRAQQSGVRVKKVFVDTVGKADKYEHKLKQLFPELTIKVANKADSLYPIVSAASVCAKVIRDRVINEWKFIEPNVHFTREDYGSGYPSDPKTKSFLAKTMDPLFGFTTFVRFSWSTIKTILDEKAIDCQWDEDDEEEEESKPKPTPKISNYFKPKSSELKSNKRQKIIPYFKDRNLQKVCTFDGF